MKEKTMYIDPAENGDELMDLLKTGAEIPLLVTGYSMMPFLRHGCDTVWLKQSDGYRRGQILFFRRSDGTFVLHRIRRIYRDGSMLVNGDAQAWCETARPDQAAAIVAAVTRNGKRIRADNFLWKMRDAVWYCTRPARPAIFAVYEKLKRKRRRR